MKKQVKEWLDYATIDLQTAKKILDDQPLSRSTAFHCHQAVEKALKAILEYLEERIPRIHDLPKLLSAVREHGISLSVNPDEITVLDGVYVGTRYPTDRGLVPEGNPTIETVSKFYETANRVLNETKAIVEHSNNQIDEKENNSNNKKNLFAENGDLT